MRSFVQEATPKAAADPRGPIESLVAQIVIPKLAKDLRGATSVPASPDPVRLLHVRAAELETFVASLLAPSDRGATRTVAAFVAGGASVDDIASSLLAPAARRLGARWADDTLDFAAVTSGMTRLHVLLHMMGRRFPAGGALAGRRVLIANNPGETHAFGPLMVAEHLRRAGWNSRFDPVATTASLAREAGSGTLDALGLSCAAERYLGDLQTCIRAVRVATRNRPICLLLGGNVFAGRPELALRMGADATADDAAGALAALQRFLPATATAH
jgi:methylmalonyl-CoA mutase cobalamin-binding subunit